MAIALVSTSSAGSGGSFVTSQAVTMSPNPTAGNLIIVAVSSSTFTANAITGVTDSLGNTYTRVVNVNPAAQETDLWYAKNITGGGANTVTVATLSTHVNAIVREYSGLDTTAPLDVSTPSGATGTSTTASSGATATTTANDELVIGVMSQGNNVASVTAGTGFGNLATLFTANSTQGLSVEDKIVATTGTQTATFAISTSTAWRCGVATFKAAGAVTSTTGQIKVYNGAAFVAKPVKVWNGSAWVTKPLKRWNGAAWVTTTY